VHDLLRAHDLVREWGSAQDGIARRLHIGAHLVLPPIGGLQQRCHHPSAIYNTLRRCGGLVHQTIGGQPAVKKLACRLDLDSLAGSNRQSNNLSLCLKKLDQHSCQVGLEGWCPKRMDTREAQLIAALA
jgi:hypothetical protein